MVKEGIIRGFASTRRVLINNMELDPQKSWEYRNHSPDGFAWGYGGSGPSQLALAILLEFVDFHEALQKYQQFKFDIIAGLKAHEDFEFSVDKVYQWLENTRI